MDTSFVQPHDADAPPSPGVSIPYHRRNALAPTWMELLTTYPLSPKCSGFLEAKCTHAKPKLLQSLQRNVSEYPDWANTSAYPESDGGSRRMEGWAVYQHRTRLSAPIRSITPWKRRNTQPYPYPDTLLQCSPSQEAVMSDQRWLWPQSKCPLRQPLKRRLRARRSLNSGRPIR